MEKDGAIERSSGPVTLVAEPSSWRTLPAGASAPADPMGSALPLRDYLRILYKHRWMILAVVVVMVTVVTVASYRMVPVYEAVGRLEINGEMPDLTSLRDLFTMIPTDEEFLQTQVRVIQSDELAMQTIRALRLHERAEFAVRPAGSSPAPFTPSEEVQLIARFRGGLAVQLLRSSRLVEVKYSAADPKAASDIVNALSDAYIENNFRKKYESTVQASEWMAGQLRELKQKMERSHEALVSYEREKQIFSLNEGQNVTLQKLGQLSTELTAAESERMARESQVRLLQSRRLDDLPALASNELVSNLKERLNQLRDQYAETRATFGPRYPRVQQLERQIEEVRGQLEQEKQQVAARIESEYQGALQREKLLRSAVDSQKAEANIMNARLVEYNLLKREYETNQQLYENLLQRLKEAGVSAGLRSNNVHVVDRARPPLAPVRPRKALNILLSLVVGLVLGCVLAIFNDYLDNSVKTPEEVEQLIGLPALGIIPSVHSVNGRNGQRALPAANKPATAAALAAKSSTSDLATVVLPHSVVSEAYRALRTSILLSTSKHPPQAILITSGQPREGKTTTALNLAITLAQRGDHVVLMDSDLRRPRVHRAFQMPNQLGLSSYLAGAAPLDSIIKGAPKIPNLSVITAGPTPPNPAELLSSEPITGLFEELRRRFDFIVMDSPPAITVADAMILAAHADGVILVAHGGVTTRESLRHTRKLLASAGARMIGVVLNNVDIRSADYRYYYSYYYGDYYRHMVEGYGYGYEPEKKEARGGRGA
jgi:capsular exopolysaccharide synthesis family protein